MESRGTQRSGIRKAIGALFHISGSFSKPRLKY
jgi:hypothetical protein